MKSALAVTPTASGARFPVHVQPRASKNEVVGAHGNALRVRLLAPPVDGAANEALVKFLAEVFGISRQSVRIISGQSSRHKTVEVDGVDPETVDELALRHIGRKNER